jgi:hypothetical protein
MAHARWGVCDDYKEALIKQRYFGSSLILKAGCFDSQLKEIRDAQSAFGEFAVKASELVRARNTARKKAADGARSASN